MAENASLAPRAAKQTLELPEMTYWAQHKISSTNRSHSSVPAVEFRRTLAPTRLEFVLTVATLILYGIFDSAGALDLANIIGPILFSIGLCWSCWRMILGGAANLWTPLLWYRVAYLTYFGLGALVPWFVNDATRELMAQFFLMYSRDAFKLNVLLVTFHLVFITVSFGTLSILDYGLSRRASNRPQAIVQSNIGVFPLGMICLSIGSAINFFVILPSIFNFYRISAISSLANFSSLSLVGYFMLTWWSLENKSNVILAVVLATAFGETIIGVLAMTKLVSLLPGVIIAIGFIYHRTTIFRILTLGLFVIVMFITITPIITYARNVNQEFYAGDPSVSEIADIYQSYFSSEKVASSEDTKDYQTGWMRLSYMNAGSFEVNQFDHGFAGRSYRYLPIVLIPRIIYPSKPIITDVSRELSYAANGNYNSSSSAGFPAEAYWNLGWTGVFIVAVVLGLVTSLWSSYSLLVLTRQAWHLFFVVLLGMRIATRIDGSLVADFVGPVGVGVLSHIALSLSNRFLPRILAGVKRLRPAQV